MKKYHFSENSESIVIAKIFTEIVNLSPLDVLVDVGSGEGHVIEFLRENTNTGKIIGYEVNLNAFGICRRNVPEDVRINIINQDIFDNFPYYATVFYLYNPFPSPYVNKFIDAILRIKHRYLIIYYNPVYLNLFEKRGKFSIYEKEIADGIPWVAIIMENGK